MQKFELPTDLLQALHAYLVTKPMVEVEQLVVALRNVKPVPPASPVVLEKQDEN